MNTSSPLDTCVVMLGSEEQGYRARATTYLGGIGCRAIVVDGASGEQMRDALQRELEQIDAPFVVLARDSDFMLPDALRMAEAWLVANPQAQGVQAYALGMSPGNSTVGYHRLGGAAHGQSGPGVRERVLAHALSGLQPWRALLRVGALRAALADASVQVAGEDWLVGLSFALLRQGQIPTLEQVLVVSECRGQAGDADALAPVIRALRQWDEQQAGDFADDEGFAILRQFVLGTAAIDAAPLLFTSAWSSVVHEPERSFEPRQYVELPYYNATVFRQLSALEFLLHAWPVGREHVRAVEGAWVRQRDLLQRQANDNRKTLRARYWEALAVNLFSPQVCQLLLEVLEADEAEAREELQHWLDRLRQVKAPELPGRLAQTASGHVLQALAAATLDAAARQRVQKRLAAGKGSQVALLVLDLEDDDAALQRTFDSVVASGLRDFRIVVLKAGILPAITTTRDTLHFVKVTTDNVVSHLNQTLKQLSCDWLMLMQAGDELAGSGLLRLQLELAEAEGLKAVCGNDVQRDSEGRLVAVLRPGADFDLLRSRPDLMAPHWLLRREEVLALGGYSETCRQALDLDLLLRLVEANGLAGLAHIDEFLVIGSNRCETMLPDALATLGRHLGQLGYRGQVDQGHEGRVLIDFRHPTTPLVSILLEAGDDMQQLATSLASIQQRTRYPRYEVLVITRGEQRQETSLGGRARMLASPAVSRADRLNQAIGEARGEYLVLMSDRSQVSSPGWIESLLNQAQRPEVGLVGCQMHDEAGQVSHAGYELLESGQVHASWLGLGVGERAEAQGLDVVRGCQAVSLDGLMIRKDVLEALGGLGQSEALDVELCLRIAQAGMLVLMVPQAQLVNQGVPVLSEVAREALVAQAPWAFARCVAVDGALGIAPAASASGPRWLSELA
ncbi:glycosyltransferase [Pantoea sp. Cy-639]|uniref:glycosyltransferase n=1 Tax=Pantoea sp. Cy-639 TaxID=2608360 RepID=UPI00141FAF74|nr:glycosyltransferase [Pantoea sp. Cy-639]